MDLMAFFEMIEEKNKAYAACFFKHKLSNVGDVLCETRRWAMREEVTTSV